MPRAVGLSTSVQGIDPSASGRTSWSAGNVFRRRTEDSGLSWFQVVDPVLDPLLRIHGSARAVRSSGFDYVLEAIDSSSHHILSVDLTVIE